MEEVQPKIDHNLYSRQIGAFGVEAMGKLIKLRVFIQGMRGVSLKLNIPIKIFSKDSRRILKIKKIFFFNKINFLSRSDLKQPKT